MKVLMLTASLGEGAGGGGIAVRTWAESIADSGVGVMLGCLDLSSHFGETQFSRHPAVRTLVFPAVVEPVTRFIIAPGLYRELNAVVKEFAPDIIHANGVWSPMTRCAAKLGKQYNIATIISPHGHLQPWAMANGTWKKMLAWGVYGKKSVQSSTMLQAATQTEADALQLLGVDRPTVVVPNVISQPDSGVVLDDRSSCDGSGRTALFLSRIHPSKGVGDLVQAWSELPTSGWRLLIAGPDEVGYAAVLINQIRRLGLTNVDYVGPVSFAERWNWYHKAELIVLPTYSENFGIAIGEAMAAGVPVVTTTAAPWPVIQQQDFGWWVEPGVPALYAALRAALALSPSALADKGQRGREYILHNYTSGSVGEKLLMMYQDARRLAFQDSAGV